ncbi:glutaredoxin [Paramecium bursaria Chlorella virus CVM-1]|nr:glutaredoxin [Paramecium bursaria Chlorella virus CVM-1]
MLVFQKRGCPHCARARKCLRKNKISFTTVTCKDVDDLKAKIKEHKLRMPRVLTFPRVFDGNKLVGGADDLEKRYILTDRRMSMKKV